MLITLRTCCLSAIHAVQQLWLKPALYTIAKMQLGSCCFTVKLVLGDVEWGRRDYDASKH